MQRHNMSYFKRIVIFMTVSALFLLIIEAIILKGSDEVDIYMGNLCGTAYEKVIPEFQTEGIADTLIAESDDEFIHVRFKGIKRGKTSVKVVCHKEGEAASTFHDSYSFTLVVTRTHFIYSNNHYDINGYQYMFFAITLVYLVFGIYMIHLFIQSKRDTFFSYHSIISLGLILYYMLQGLALLPFSATAMIHPEKMNGLYFFTFNSFVLTAVSLLSTPFLLIFSLLLSISNIKLIKKEGKRLSNLLGILLSFVLLSGVVIIFIMFMKSVLLDYLTITPKKMAINLTRGIISSIFVYFECNLLATLFLARKAGRHKPKYDKDFIIILGCGIREDGTLYPLLRGRADRAINFYKEQLEKTGKKAVFIPSGGQGPDEIMPEGEAIKRYLIEQGIPEEQIMAETRSLNTLQNMQFSKEIIDSNSSDANIAFSTTNYHVFRGGMLASSVGMNADGMGAKTKWYFWPNSLIREFVGMLVKERKIHIFLLIIIVTQAIIMGNIQLLLNLL